MEDENKDNEVKMWLIGCIVTGIIIGLWFLTLYLLKDYDKRGTFGDMFGSINALYSGLAFAGIIFTILLQRKELGYQREELRETRQEFIKQNKTLKAQRFENTFFNLVSLHNQIVNDIDYDKPYGGSIISVRGRDVFRDRYKVLEKQLKNSSDINRTYLEFYEKRKTDFGHYFRNLYRVIKMVHETEFVSMQEITLKYGRKFSEEQYNIYNHKERYRYTSILRAQLSDYELLFLFYNCLSDNGNEKFKPLVEEYALLKNIPQSDVPGNLLSHKYAAGALRNKFEDKSYA